MKIGRAAKYLVILCVFVIFIDVALDHLWIIISSLDHLQKDLLAQLVRALHRYR